MTPIRRSCRSFALPALALALAAGPLPGLLRAQPDEAAEAPPERPGRDARPERGPPDREGPPGPRGPRDRGGPPPGMPRPPRDSLREALDANGDRELDAEEIAAAPAALERLDANGDGRIDREEFRPPLPPGPPPRPFPGRGFGDRFRRGPEDSAAPPPRGEGDEPRPPGPPGEGFRPRQGGEPGRGRPPGPAAGRGPIRERFVDRLMEFDADGDGRIGRDEIERFVEEMAGRVRPRPEPPRSGDDADAGREDAGREESGGDEDDRDDTERDEADRDAF